MGRTSLSNAVVKGNTIKYEVEIELPNDQEITRSNKNKCNLYFFPKIISCKIPTANQDPECVPDDPECADNIPDDLAIFLKAQNIQYTFASDLECFWQFGRVIKTSTGFNREFHVDGDLHSCLMFLGDTEDKAKKLMTRLTYQHNYLKSQQ